MTNLIMLCGIPGAGKSTFIKNNIHKFKGYVSVESRDEVRYLIVREDEPYFSKENEVFKTWTNHIKEDIAAGVDTVIADATHLNKASRIKLINALGDSLKNVKVTAIAIESDVNTCILQNENRKGTRGYVPKDAIINMAKSYKSPTFEEKYLDEIITYKRR